MLEFEAEEKYRVRAVPQPVLIGAAVESSQSFHE